jgi:hypothetical protein
LKRSLGEQWSKYSSLRFIRCAICFDFHNADRVRDVKNYTAKIQ